MHRPHPNLFVLIETLQSEEERVEHEQALLRAGAALPPQRPSNGKITERLVRLRHRLLANNITVYEYAGAVAATLKQSVVYR